MLKKNIITLSLILFLANCGFTSVYVQNKNINFSIEQVEYTGDRDFNNFLKINLDRYKNEKDNNQIFLNVDSKYKKSILSKDSTGKITSYRIEIEVIFTVKSTNKKIRITEKKIVDSNEDKFDEARYERSIKQSFAYSISNKLVSELVIN
jgi:outer membrane lipopolysaccharide assembly protein LptE/RlpB